jgi:hypothetical protein
MQRLRQEGANQREENLMKRGIVMLLCVTGLAAIALIGSTVVSSRKRETPLPGESEEYWYPYMLA